jgi:hypothetical protein
LSTQPSSPGPRPLPGWSLALQGPEYDLLLPALSSLPDAIAYRIAHARGRFNARHDRDWVSLGLRHRHVAAQVAEGFGLFLPPAQARAALIERFETVSREEMETRALARLGIDHFLLDAQPALEALAQRPRDRGIVLVTAHHETFLIGIAALGLRGEVVHTVTSTVSGDPRLHPAVRRHFARKYEGLRLHGNGGGTPEVEISMRHFYRALARHEAVVVLCDAPAPPGSPALCVPWMGAHRHMAQGAFRLAEATGSLMAAFGCRWQGGRRHAVRLSALLDPKVLGMAGCALQAFGFLEAHLRERPGRWWGSHLLPACAPCDPGRPDDEGGPEGGRDDRAAPAA